MLSCGVSYTHRRSLSYLESTQIFFNLFAAAVGEEAAGLCGFCIAANAAGNRVAPAGKALAFQRVPKSLRRCRAARQAGGEPDDKDATKSFKAHGGGQLIDEERELSQIGQTLSSEVGKTRSAASGKIRDCCKSPHSVQAGKPIKALFTKSLDQRSGPVIYLEVYLARSWCNDDDSRAL